MCLRVCVMNHIVGGLSDKRSVEVFLLRCGYQVWSELELELESKHDNCRETIWLQLMCCAPYVLLHLNLHRGCN